jgi:hypothetical protein
MASMVIKTLEMKFYLVLRATEDWSSLSLDNYFDQPRACIYPDEHIEERQQLCYNLNKWDQYETDFFRYRARLKEIAMNHWTLPHITLDEAAKIKDPNIIFIPIDDDDIIHPNIVNYIRHWYNIPEVDSVTWNGWAYSLLRSRPVWTQEHEQLHPNPYYNTLLLSNAYSIRSNLADSNMMMQHDVFSDIKYMTKVHLQNKLALRLVHPGGTWLMQHMPTFGAELFHWSRLVIPNQVEWSRQYIESVTDLTKKIFDSPKTS